MLEGAAIGMVGGRAHARAARTGEPARCGGQGNKVVARDRVSPLAPVATLVPTSQANAEGSAMGSSENPAPHHETPTFGSPDLPPEGMETTTGDPASTKMTGPRNPVLESQFSNVVTAPATDISTQPFFWSSFNISPRRQQRGDGRARSHSPISRFPTRSPG
jgi:hypothetical protein